MMQVLKSHHSQEVPYVEYTIIARCCRGPVTTAVPWLAPWTQKRLRDWLGAILIGQSVVLRSAAHTLHQVFPAASAASHEGRFRAYPVLRPNMSTRSDQKTCPPLSSSNWGIWVFILLVTTVCGGFIRIPQRVRPILSIS